MEDVMNTFEQFIQWQKTVLTKFITAREAPQVECLKPLVNPVTDLLENAMAGPPARSVWGSVFKNFINSFRPRQIRGTLIGTDYFGNKYYEIPPDPSIGKRKANRWFQPPQNDDFMQEMPAEWEAWLRGRRKEPPTEEEVLKNYAIMQMKKKNAIEVEAKAGKMTPMLKGMETFPQRPEYERIPGEKD